MSQLEALIRFYRVLTIFPHIILYINISYSLHMRVLLENTTFSLHKIIRNGGTIRIVGIIQGRALYEECTYEGII